MLIILLLIYSVFLFNFLLLYSAASGDNLKLWKLESNGANFLGALSTSKSSEACSPITSFDWNSVDYNIIGTASIDTTCTIWDIEAQKVFFF